jgi:DNA uptake protein ComE-like DNA-binding protein
MVEAVTPFVESVANTVGSVVSALVEAAEQFIEDAEKSIVQEPEDVAPIAVAAEPEVAKPAKKATSRVLKAKPEPKTVLSLNAVTEEQLTELKGISKAVAKAIVDARPYARWDEVATVKGVGGKLLIKLKANFVL